MTTQPTARASKGICSFCNGEFGKGKMTQHLLKYCKQRAAHIAVEAEDTTQQKARLFHISVEGKYNPRYWLHLEIPASESLSTLDDFLRAIWLERYEHLSGFKIDGTSYSLEGDDYVFLGAEKVIVEGVQTDESEFDNTVNGEEILKDFPPEYVDAIPSEVLAELRKSWSDEYDLVAFLKEKLKSIHRGGYPRTPEEENEFRRRYFYRHAMEWLLDIVEDRSMHVPLEKVLKVGQKFFYEFDFGSTTHLTLKVAAEREGVVQKKKRPVEHVELLARNKPPEVRCRECGQPATKLVCGYYHVEEDAYCDICARKASDSEMILLPIINSPRVGVL